LKGELLVIGEGRDKGPPPEPAGEDIGALLNEAEDIVNSAAPDILAEFDAKGRKGRFRRKKKRK